MTASVLRSIILFMTLTSAVLSQEKPFPPPWVQDAVFYQIFPERFADGDPANDPRPIESWDGVPTTRNFFGGDLKGILDHLDHLTSLGVNAIYLNPIFEASTNHKYNTKDYLRIDPHFGDEGTFRQLLDSCHARGIRVILDGVFNHTGVDFFAFDDIRRNGPNSRYLTWYNVRKFPLGSRSRPNYEAWWGNGDLPKLMTGNPEVRKYLFDVTRFWLEFGIDGWRLDVPNEIPHEFWVEWRTLVKSVNPDAYIVGEIWDDARPWLQGDQFDGVMNYRFRTACVNFFAKRKLDVSEFDAELAKQRSAYSSAVNAALLNLLGSHDTERFLTLCKGDTSAMSLAVLFQMAYIGAPMIYYGDEIGMTGGKDPGCRGPMAWDKDKQDRALLEIVKAAVVMRREHAALRTGTFETVLLDDDLQVYGFVRRVEAETALVLLNNGTQRARVRVPSSREYGVAPWGQIWPVERKAMEYRTTDDEMAIPAKSGVVLIGRK